MSLREIAESLFNRINGLQKEYEQALIKQSETEKKNIFSAEETYKQRIRLREKYEALSQNLITETADYVNVGISTDKSKVQLTETQIEKNVPWLAADITTVSLNTYTDEETFNMIQRYIGDFNTMLRFARVSNIMNSDDLPVSRSILSLPYKLRTLENNIRETYATLLNLVKCSFQGADNGIVIAVTEQNLIELIGKHETILDITQKAKRTDFSEISKLDNPSV